MGTNPKWTDAHFCSLQSQPNVYSHTKVMGTDGVNKLLVASLGGKVAAIEYQRNIKKKLTPSSRHVQFTYIPNDAEIVSMDVINECHHSCGLIVGITFLKIDDNENNASTQFLNIYSSSQPDNVGEYDIDSIAQWCLIVELLFIPYQLTHTELVSSDGREYVFLLTGSDNHVHMYKEVFQEHTFEEAPILEYFPEFKEIPSSVLWLDIEYFDDYHKRITARGHQNGLIWVSMVDTDKREVLQEWSTQHDSPISCVRLFTPDTKVKCPSFIDVPNADISDEEADSVPVFNVVVTSALELAVVYRDILHYGLKDQFLLPDSDKYDAVLCACVADIDFDGKNDILVGTYGQELLAYKFYPGQSSPSRVKKPEKSPDQMPIASASASSILTPTFDNWSNDSTNKHRHKSNENHTSTLQCQTTRRVKSSEDLTVKRRGSDQGFKPIRLKEPVSADFKDIVASGSPVSLPPAIDSKDLQTSDSPISHTHGQEKSYISDESKNEVINEGYQLLWQRSFAAPIVGADHVDIMSDGMDDLVVVTLNGIHILQPDLTAVAKVCLERLRIIADCGSDTEEMEKLRISSDSESDSDDAYRKLQEEIL